MLEFLQNRQKAAKTPALRQGQIEFVSFWQVPKSFNNFPMSTLIGPNTADNTLILKHFEMFCYSAWV